MSPARTVVVALAMTALIVSLSRTIADRRLPRMRALLGVAIVAAVLLMISDIAPKVATGLAVLVLTSAATVSGAPAFGAVASVVGERRRSPGSTPRRPNITISEPRHP